jgi:hypothetical protein
VRHGDNAMNDLLAGGIMVASAAIGLFFLRFWRMSRDRLFLMFAAAFWVYGLHRLGLSLLAKNDEVSIWFYVVRFLTFFLILIAIADKNRRGQR